MAQVPCRNLSRRWLARTPWLLHGRTGAVVACLQPRSAAFNHGAAWLVWCLTSSKVRLLRGWPD